MSVDIQRSSRDEDAVFPRVSASAKAGIRLRDHVSWCCVDDVVFILDTLSGQYHGLPPESSQLWRALFSFNAGELDPSKRSDGDAVANLIQSLRRRNWIVHADVVDDVSARTRRTVRDAHCFLALDALCCLVGIRLTLRFRGFRAAYGRAKSYATMIDDRTGPGAKPVDLETAMAAFHRAERVVLSGRGLDDCLPRSLALFIYLRRCNLAARHVIGIRRYPFAAHAWVEHADEMLLEPRHFGTIPNMAPSAGPDRRRGLVPIAAID